MKTACLYLRVSTGLQTTEKQRLELVKLAEKRGWEIVQIYEDVGFSGSKGRDRRPALDKMMKDASKRKFDVMMAWSVNMVGRSLQDLVRTMNGLHSVGVDMYLHQQGVDTTTPSGKALFQLCGFFAEFERAMIVDRVNAGLSRAKQRGKTLGRRKTATVIEDKIRQLRTEGKGILRIAKELGIGTSVVQRVVNEALSA